MSLLLMRIALYVVFALPASAIGLTYEYLSQGHCTSVHVLTVDPEEHLIMPMRAAGRETVKSLTGRSGAAAAVNGGFWKLNGEPAGILKIGPCWHGLPSKPRGAIGWSLDGKRVLIDRVLTEQGPDGEILVIPQSVPQRTTIDDWKEMEYIVGGSPVLINMGNLIEDYTPELTLHSFLIKKHPRTAVGVKDDGSWVFAVVDGCFFGLTGGMTIRQLAELLLEMGCIEALNLDGGGSSTMVMDGAVVNNPSGKNFEDGKRVEAVSDAILIMNRE